MRNALEAFTMVSPADPGDRYMRSFEQGMRIGDELRKRKALRAFTQDPDNPESLEALIAASPELGFRAADYQRKRAEGRREDEFNGALSQYVTGHRNALSPQRGALSGAVAPERGAPVAGALSPFAPNALAQPPAQLKMPGQGPVGAVVDLPTEPGQPPAAAPAGPDLSFLGEPENDADDAFLVMLQRDPKRALEIDSKLRDNFVDRAKAEHEAFGYGIARLGGVSDPATYQQRRAEIIQRFSPLGIDIAAALPEQFPGEEGLQAIRLRGLDLKDQLAALLNRENVEADNARADRNADSLIADRGVRRDIQRRGQDIRSGDTRRGQDVRAGVTRRGQNLRGSGGGRGSGGSAGPVRVKTVAEAMKLPAGTVYRTPDGQVMTR